MKQQKVQFRQMKNATTTRLNNLELHKMGEHCNKNGELHTLLANSTRHSTEADKLEDRQEIGRTNHKD